METIKLRWWPFLFGMLAAQSGFSQQQENISKESASVPCLRAYCGRLVEPAERPATGVGKTMRATPIRQSSDEREWKEHADMPGQGEDYNCLLSVGFGGELQSKGYKGVRLLGQTRTLKRSGAGSPQ